MKRIKSVSEVKGLKFGEQYIIEPPAVDDTPEAFADAYHRVSEEINRAAERIIP